MLKRSVCGLLLVLLAGAAALVGQEAGDDQVIRVEVERVNVIVTVTDKNGRFVTDLPQERFEIYENGERQEITNFDNPTDLPLQMALILDTSQSVRTQLDFEKQAARQFVLSLMQRKDRALLVEFDRGVNLVQDFTDRPSMLARAIDNLRAGGGTALFDAIYRVSLDKMSLGRGQDRKVILLITDGMDRDSRRSRDEALEMALRNEVSIYSVGTNRFGADQRKKGWNTLEKLSEKTGGLALFPYSVGKLEESFDKINKELRSQYLLVYNPTNDAKDGKYRKIRVKLKKKGDMRLRHREGYYAETSEEGMP
ncbi:MAG TPA: VWA domain-containing protein [Acidobacteriota bacterium]|nr:VWA domain-containing protein [Acidobacteriota bacterium]